MARAVLKGGDKLAAALAEISRKVSKKSKLSVGFFEGSTEANGTSTAMIAAIQDGGAPSKGIPPRPFFRNMIREGAKHWGDDLAKILVANEYDASLTLSQMGEEMIGELKDSIRDMNSPSLSPVTLLLRERFGNNPAAITFKDVMQAREDIASGRVPAVTSTQSKPLIWTGDMISAVGKEVE